MSKHETAFHLPGETRARFLRRMALNDLDYLATKCGHATTVQPIRAWINYLTRELKKARAAAPAAHD